MKVTKANRKEAIAKLIRAGAVGLSSTSTTAEVRAVAERFEKAKPVTVKSGGYVGQRSYTPREHDLDTRYRYNGRSEPGESVFFTHSQAPNWRVGQTVTFNRKRFRVEAVRDNSRGVWFYLE